MYSIVYMYMRGGYNPSVINTSILVVATEQHIIGVHTRDLHCSYLNWVSSWINHLSNQPSVVKVPPAAWAVNSPLDVSN